MRTLLVTIFDYHTYIPPLGAACITGVLKRHGFEAHNLTEFTESDNSKYAMISDRKNDALNPTNLDAMVTKIESYSPDIVGFSCFLHNRRSTSLVARKLKERNPGIVLVGGGPDIHPLRTEQCGIELHKQHMDYLVQGEGENKILKLYGSLVERKDLEDPAGIFRSSEITNTKIYSGYRERVQNLDALPFPDFGEDPQFARYKDASGFWGGIPISFSRGCTGSCSFCSRNEYFHGYRFRSAKSMLAEIEYQTARYGEDRFIIVDDDPLARQALPEIEQLAELIIRSGKRYQWEIHNARIHVTLARKDLARKLRVSGLARIAFGVESLSPSVSAHIGKPIDARVAEQVLTAFSECGINTGAFLIYGYPTETESDFSMTLDWLEKRCNTVKRLDLTCFIMTDWYLKKRPGTVVYHGHLPGRSNVSWESRDVNEGVLWERFGRVKDTVESRFHGYCMISDPLGNFHIFNGASRRAVDTVGEALNG